MFLEFGARCLLDQYVFMDPMDHGGYVEILPGDHGSFLTKPIRKRILQEMADSLDKVAPIGEL